MAAFVLSECNGRATFAKDYAEIPGAHTILGKELQRVELTEEEAKWPIFSLMLILIQRGKIK